MWNYMNENKFHVAPSRGWPAGVVLPSRPRPVSASAPSGAKPSVSRRDDTEVRDSSILLAYEGANPVLRSYPSSISINFYPIDVRT
jgi:hypothetical protein